MLAKNLFPPQQEVMKYGFLETGFHCLLNMATGSGKTFLAEYAMERCLERGFRAIYLTPLKAIADEKFEAWKDQFPGTNIGLFTGDVISGKSRKMPCSYKSAQIYIMTPERLDMCLRNWRTHWRWIPEIDLLVVDELHLLNDPGRGPRLEGAVTRLVRLNPFARILGLSATMSNVSQLSDWLQGVHFSSKWRQVPLAKRVLRFSKVQEKLPLLINEVTSCAKGGGRSLVFANSRSRAQSLAQALRESGLRALHHHAGLKHEDRKKVEHAFRSGEIEVLVATSTLEMGINLPARQVIIFDSYSFDGTGFSPLPVWSFMQRAGRAGRPGLDPEGEVVLFLPKWAGKADQYINEDCEPVSSQLTSSRAMAEQILIELFAGYSKTREHLQHGFLPLTLYQHQHPGANITKITNILVRTDMVKIKYKEDSKGNEFRTLKPTRLGRLAVRLMFLPSSVKLIKDLYVKIESPYFFDLLLIASLTQDCSPALPSNYEDLDYLMDIIQPAPGRLLELSLQNLQRASDECPSSLRVLAAVKMAAICYALTNNMDKEVLARTFDIYAADIDALKDSVVRLLDGMSAILQAIDEEESNTIDDAETNTSLNSPGQLCRRISAMLYYEIDNQGVNLTYIPGVGGKIARQLIGCEYDTIEKISTLKPKDLTKVQGIGQKLAKKIIAGAKEVAENEKIFFYTEENHKPTNIKAKEIKTDICPYRLRRSMELRIRGHEGKFFFVTGGREDHVVSRSTESFSCDCKDFESRQQDCKHILAVKYFLKDRHVCTMIKKIKEDKSHSLRSALPSLWFSTSGRTAGYKVNSDKVNVGTQRVRAQT